MFCKICSSTSRLEQLTSLGGTNAERKLWFYFVNSSFEGLLVM